MRRVGRYTLYEELASGGYATVHIARLEGDHGFGRTVAIKRLHDRLADDEELHVMLRDEARVASFIHHANVVQMVDVIENGKELLLVLEYVHGQSLAELLRTVNQRGERVPPRIAAAILAGVLRGLHAAHDAKDDSGQPLAIVHRDVSPQNILVGVDGEARVLDFGIAKAFGRLHETRDGKVRGKLPYMAPEQLARADVTRQADVYAAAAVLWECLAGKPRMDVSNDVAIVHFVLREQTPPPSSEAPGIAPELDRIVLRGLTRGVSERYATAREMMVELEACGMASPAEVGAWVESLAPEELARRSALVARAERGEDGPPPAAASERKPTAKPPQNPQERQRKRTNPWFYALAAVSLAIGGWLAVLVSRRASAHPPPTAAAPDPPSSSSVAAPVAMPSPSDSAATVSSVDPVSSAPAPSPKPTRFYPRAPRRPTFDCNPPWLVDAEGHKRYKEGCFTKPNGGR